MREGRKRKLKPWLGLLGDADARITQDLPYYYYGPDARYRTWWAFPVAVVHLPFMVTMTNISRWAWNGVQQTKKTSTTATSMRMTAWRPRFTDVDDALPPQL